MMKQLFLLSLLLLTLTGAKAQSSFPLLDTNAIWTSFWNGYPFPENLLHKLCGDTTIDGVVYAKLYESRDSVFNLSSIKTQYAGGIRDSSGYIFFRRKHENAGRLLYNFKANVNDTVGYVYFDTGDSAAAHIGSIDSVQIQGIYRKRWNMAGTQIFRPASWIEGIGSTAGLLLPYSHCPDLSFGCGYLLCYKNTNQLLYQDTTYNTCYVNVGLRESEKNKATIRIYPHPLSDESTMEIQDANHLKDLSISIYSIHGQLLRTEEIINPRFHLLSKGNLTKGLYFFTIHAKGSQLTSGKLLVN